MKNVTICLTAVCMVILLTGAFSGCMPQYLTDNISEESKIKPQTQSQTPLQEKASETNKPSLKEIVAGK